MGGNAFGVECPRMTREQYDHRDQTQFQHFAHDLIRFPSSFGGDVIRRLSSQGGPELGNLVGVVRDFTLTSDPALSMTQSEVDATIMTIVSAHTRMQADGA